MCKAWYHASWVLLQVVSCSAKMSVSLQRALVWSTIVGDSSNGALSPLIYCAVDDIMLTSPELQ